jgi:hypothetical protein
VAEADGQVRSWTIRGRGDHHVPELDGPYLDHNVVLELVELPERAVLDPAGKLPVEERAASAGSGTNLQLF